VQKQLKQISIFFGCILLSACWSGQQKEQNLDDNLMIVNVLDKDSFNDCHIKGSINIMLDGLEEFAAKIDKSREVVVYCSNYLCSTSEFAAKKLKSFGCKHVYVYEAGLAEWYQKGLPVEGPSKASYLKKQVGKPILQSNELLVLSTEDLVQKMKLT
jgi:rhodanese-related sulfurtransferase